MDVRSVPKKKTMEKWKGKWNWLVFSEKEKMIRALCIKHKEKLSKCMASTTFVIGRDNYKTSALFDHEESKFHLQIIEED